MKYLAFIVLAIFLSTLPLAAAQENALEVNMTLDDSFVPLKNETIPGCPPGSSCAVATVNVTLVELPQPPITGMFLEQFDFEGFIKEIVDFFSDLLKRL